MSRKRKILKRFAWTLAIVFLFMNVVAVFHSCKFTHFSDSGSKKTQKPEQLTFTGKMEALIFGVKNPRPVNKAKPTQYYETVRLESDGKIECWYLHNDKSADSDSVKGTIIICHGYSGEKSSMLGQAGIFDSLKFDSFLIDFMGCGGSEGNTTTIGYNEAEQVKAAYDYLVRKGIKNIYLFGTSMGAVAIMKALKDYNLKPAGIIIECPFGSMYQTVAARFENMNLPAFPMAGLLVFWGGLQNGYWAFGHNPTEYAKHINSPVLLLYGEKDTNVSREEIDDIYANLTGPKTLKTYKLAGHENYLTKYSAEWTQDVSGFLSK